MTTGRHLEALRVHLTVLHGELCDLAIKTELAPKPHSPQYDAYVRRLDALELQLRLMQQKFGRVARQGPAHYGPNDDRFKVKQRQNTFRDQVTTIEELIARCCQRFVTILAPDKRSLAQGAGEVAKQLEKMLKGSDGAGVLGSVIADGPSFSAPLATSVDVGVSGFVTLGILTIAAVKKRLNRS